MTTLAYYSSIVKKENVMLRLKQDAEETAAMANDLACELKILAASCQNKNLEESIENINKSEEILKTLSPLIQNIKENINGYASSLVSMNKNLEQAEQQVKEDNKISEENNLEQKKELPSVENIAAFVDAIKSLKEIQQNSK